MSKYCFHIQYAPCAKRKPFIWFTCFFKMTARSTKVSLQWLQRFDEDNIQLKNFLVRQNDFELKCIACDRAFSVKSKGFHAVTQHMDSAKHKGHMKTKFDKLQQRIQIGNQEPSTSAQNSAIQLFASKDEATKAELLLLLHGLSNNCSFRSFDNLAHVLQLAITDSQIAKLVSGCQDESEK